VTLTKRVVVCLDVRGDRVVKGTQFVDLRDVGDPVALAERYEAEGADEIVFLDIGATPDARGTMLELATRTAERLFIPLTIGGGIRTVDDATAALRAGADKIGINSAGVARPELFTEVSRRLGAQCVVASIDAKAREDGGWEVYVSGGRTPTGLDAVQWAREVVARGAGEILLTSIDRDGARSGYDLALTRAVAAAVSVPVVASGGAGSARDVSMALSNGADAALVAGILHDGLTTVGAIKRVLQQDGIRVRNAA
jgi:imidazole glycerol-phosphate synthase subunit HisF